MRATIGVVLKNKNIAMTYQLCVPVCIQLCTDQDSLSILNFLSTFNLWTLQSIVTTHRLLSRFDPRQVSPTRTTHRGALQPLTFGLYDVQ